jgi:hypothetical protein
MVKHSACQTKVSKTGDSSGFQAEEALLHVGPSTPDAPLTVDDTSQLIKTEAERLRVVTGSDRAAQRINEPRSIVSRVYTR